MLPIDTDAAAGRGAGIGGGEARQRMRVINLAAIEKAEELRRRAAVFPGREIVAELGERHPATVAGELRGIEGAADVASAIAALLGRQSRVEAVLAGERSVKRKIVRQRLRAVGACLELGEVRAPVADGSERAPHLRAAKPLEALAHGNVPLIAGLEAIGEIAVDQKPHSAQLVVAEGKIEERALRFAREQKSGQREIALQRTDQRVAHARFEIRAFVAVVEREQLAADAAGAIGSVEEKGEPLDVQDLAIFAAQIFELVELKSVGIGQSERLVLAEQIVERGRAQRLIRPFRDGAAIVEADEEI